MFDDILIADGFNDALIGVTSRNVAVYDIDKCIEVLKKDMPEDEAVEYFFYNVEGAHMGDQTPIYIYQSDITRILDNSDHQKKIKKFRKHSARA